jgi:hypothetical protein
MSDTEQQWADQVQLERELEEAFQDIDDGLFLTLRQIDLLRYACGLPKKHIPNTLLSEVFDSFAGTFGENK